MAVIDCKTGAARGETPEELAAIAALRAATTPIDPGLGALTVTEFLQAMVAEGAITQTRATNILNRLKR